MNEPRNIQVLFVGKSTARIAWYRIVLPAMYLGCDWMGVSGEPPKLRFATGYVKGDTRMARFEDYDLVVVQQPAGKGWFHLIRRLQSREIPVLYEIDDYAHGIRKDRDHDFADEYPPKVLRSMELCMRAADGMIVTNEYLQRRYQRFNDRIWVCPNGLDMARYRLSRPPRRPTVNGQESVNIMWSGATGHVSKLTPWLEVVARVMTRHQHVRFISIGHPVAQMIDSERSIAIPFAFLDTYPAAMMNGDIALAPGGATAFYRAKSPLRAMEAAALGIPVIADPQLYGSAVNHGQTGFLACTPQEVEEYLELLIADRKLRLQLGDQAREHAKRYDMRVQVEHWKTAIIGALT